MTMNASPSTAEIVIVGGGVIGTSIAWHLARRGARVTLLEQRGLAAAASGASAGGVRQQGRDLREMPLAIRSIARWEHLSKELEADIHYFREGHIQVTECEDDLPRMRESVARQRAAGLDIRLVEGDELRDLVPGITPNALAGTYTANDGHANPILTTHAFAAAAQRAGATIRLQTRVTGIERRDGTITGVATTNGRVGCDWLVLAAGAWSTDLARAFDIDLPVTPIGLQMMATTPMPPQLRQVVGALNRKLSLKQIPSGNYVIGGGWPGDPDLGKSLATPRYTSILGSMTDSSAIYPELRKARLERVWVGIEAETSDLVPILGPLPGIDNLTVATGFTGHGFALSPIVGQLMSELILDGEPSIPLAELSFARFAGETSTAPTAPRIHAG
ncbi:MAG: FAD-binding oxidoreductase [Thermomicrobiales bacterium]